MIAGADLKPGARSNLLRYGGIGLLAVGTGGYGYLQATSAAAGLDAADAAEWAALWQQGRSGEAVQRAGQGSRRWSGAAREFVQ